MLIDNHGRSIQYVRLALTDRCNLRCFYCMPAEGIDYLPAQHLLSRTEIQRLIAILKSIGITKVRLTGGEPLLRKDFMAIFQDLVAAGITDLHLTTNGILLLPILQELQRLGLKSVNLSLDTLDETRYAQITRRQDFPTVRATLDKLIESGIPLKINAVVMEDKNIADLKPLAELTRETPVEVRFIEEMPFNGAGAHYPVLHWTHTKIRNYLAETFPGLEKVPVPKSSTSELYRIPGYVGKVGIIAAYSRTFCGTCDRLRITAQGMLKTCLYDGGVFSLRDLLRSNADDLEVKNRILQAVGQRPKDGFEAEAKRSPVVESMSTIGG